MDKQKLLIENMLASPDLYTICASIVKPEYFELELQKSVRYIQDYVEKYNNIPKLDTIYAETGIQYNNREVSKDEIEYTSVEVEKFCKLSSVLEGVRKVVGCIESDELDCVVDIMQDAVTVSLKRDLGIEYFKEPKERLDRLKTSHNFQSTGWDELDKLLGGGLVDGQMIMFTGNSGTGKSITLSNLSQNLLEQKLDVLYISLELSEDLVSLRYDGLIAGHNQVEWRYHIDATVDAIKRLDKESGTLFIKYMPSGTNANQVRGYLKEFELQNNFLPKVLVLDYIDIAGANSGISGNNVFEKDKETSEQFRNLVNEYDMYLLTASQQNRSAVNVIDTDHSHISGGISKINTADYVFSIQLTESMKAEGVIGYKCIKSRSSDGVDKKALLKYNGNSLKISNLNSKESNNILSNLEERADYNNESGNDIINEIIEITDKNYDNSNGGLYSMYTKVHKYDKFKKTR